MNTPKTENSLFLLVFTKLRKTIINFIISVYPHGTTQLLLDEFL
jgi:hypothetical protein